MTTPDAKLIELLRGRLGDYVGNIYDCEENLLLTTDELHAVLDRLASLIAENEKLRGSPQHSDPVHRTRGREQPLNEVTPNEE